MRTSAYLLRQLPQIKLVHTGLETPLSSHYFLSVHPFLAFLGVFWVGCLVGFCWIWVFFNSFFLLTYPYFDSPFPYLSPLLPLLLPGDRRKKNPISYCLNLFSSLSINVDFTLFMHTAQMMINTRLTHWKICRKLCRAKLCDLL